MRRFRHLGATAALIFALAFAFNLAAPADKAEAAGCGFLGLWPCNPAPGEPTGTATGCGFLGWYPCPPPPTGTTASTVPCGFLGLERCPVSATPPPPPPTTGAPDPGGNESLNVATPPPGGRLFGFNSGLFDTETTAANEVGLERAVGANAQRYSIHWRMLQPNSTSPVLPNGNPPLGGAPVGSELWRYDSIYQELVSKGMKPIIIMYAAPAWATAYASCGLLDLTCQSKQKGTLLYPDAKHIAAWKAFVGAIANRYPQAAIETWNEPNIVSYWGGDKPNPTLMAQLQCAAYQAVKAQPSQNTVLSPGFAVYTQARNDGSPLFKDYITTMFNQGLKGCMDDLAVHMYAANNLALGVDSPFAKVWEVVRQVRTTFSESSPIWVTETGSMSDKGAVTSDPSPLTEAQQSDLNQRLYNRMAQMPDVKTIIFNSLRNAPVPSLRGKTTIPEYHFGFLREDWTPKPVFCAFVLKAGKTFAGC